MNFYFVHVVTPEGPLWAKEKPDIHATNEYYFRVLTGKHVSMTNWFMQ